MAATPTGYRPYSADGVLLDAHFYLETVDNLPTLIMKSRGGTKGKPDALNTDYLPALAELLCRLGEINYAINDILIASERTKHLSAEQRRLHMPDHPYPILPSADVAEAERLRKAICRQQARTGKKNPNSKGGNTTKCIQIFLDHRGYVDLDLGAHLINEPEYIGNSMREIKTFAPPASKPPLIKPMRVDAPFDPADVSKETVTHSRQRKDRKGQAIFRATLLEAYEGKCAITGCNVQEVLEAAHIIRHINEASHHPGNGILLRLDLHRLFDLFLLTVDPENAKVIIKPALLDTEYKDFAGRTIAKPDDPNCQPSYRALQQRMQAFQRGSWP